MPFCWINTNVAKKDIPDDLHLKLTKAISETLGRPEERITVLINSGLDMCRAGSFEPNAVLFIWEWGLFGPENNPTYTKKIREVIEPALKLTPDRLILGFRPVNLHDIGLPLKN